MHHTINEPPKDKKKYLWQKNHLENQTGTINSYKPNIISKLNNSKKKYDTWKN
jgi:NADH:ubiquinone oxidoreductase subunit